MDFKEVVYQTSKHAVDSYIERTKKHDLTIQEAKRELINNLYNAEIVIENERYRYLKLGPYYYPCVKNEVENKIIYTATTTLTRKMLDSGFYFEEALAKYLPN